MSFLNLLIYVCTNRDYRAAYVDFLAPRKVPPRPPQRRNFATMTRMISFLAFIGTTIATHEVQPDLSTKAPACSTPWETHHRIPPCTQTVQWLHILTNGTVCSRRITCSDQQMVTADAKTCMDTTSECKTRQRLNLDHIQCQTPSNAHHVEQLRIHPLRSTLCTVGAFTLRHCDDFTEEITTVPIAIVNHHAYPLDTMNLAQHAHMKELSSYSCEGEGDNQRCDRGDCGGTPLF